MFLDHTQRRSTVGRTPLDEWSARRRDLYLTTHDTHNRQISCVVVCDLETSRIGAPYIYDISNLRVNNCNFSKAHIVALWWWLWKTETCSSTSRVNFNWLLIINNYNFSKAHTVASWWWLWKTETCSSTSRVNFNVNFNILKCISWISKKLCSIKMHGTTVKI